ncbi:MAG: twin-arginine translocation signal domain-containing protein, partial [Rhodospirillales bacterium]
MENDKRSHLSRRDVVKLTGAGVALAALGTGVLIPGRGNAATMKAKALFFDVGGTILDWSAMPDKMTKYFSEKGIKIDGKAFWIPWRTKIFFYMMYNSMI